MKTKVKAHGDKVTFFMIKTFLSNHTCLAVISLDFALKKEQNCYRQVFLKEHQYVEKKVIRSINDNFNDFFTSDESDGERIRVLFSKS